MKRMIAISVLFLSFQVFAAGAPGSPVGAVLSAETANVVAPPVTLNGQCSTPATGCSAGQWIKAKIGGRATIGGVITPAVFTGTVACYFSRDGANWTTGFIRTTTTAEEPFVTFSATAAFAASSTLTYYTCLPTLGAWTDVALVSTAAVTNTAASTLVISNTPMHLIEAMLSPKGTQSNLNLFLPVQQAKDAGRSFVVLGADGVTPAIAETVITFSKNVAGTVTGAQTTYAVTSGKTLRVQSLCASYTAGAVANRVRVALRLNTGGACIAGSGLLLPALELAPQYGTAAASEGWAGACVPVPDGLELTGASWNICLSETAVAASGTLTVNLIGYEY